MSDLLRPINNPSPPYPDANTQNFRPPGLASGLEMGQKEPREILFPETELGQEMNPAEKYREDTLVRQTAGIDDMTGPACAGTSNHAGRGNAETGSQAIEEAATCCMLACVIIVTIAIVAVPMWILLSSGNGGDGTGWSGGGCFDNTTVVWTKNETDSDEHATRVIIKNLIEGNLVGTIDINSERNVANNFIWSRATDVTIYTGNYKAHSFKFSNGHHLTVTSPHLMIIWKNGISYFVRADEVRVGDEMQVGKAITSVSKIKNHMIEEKVAVETEDGTIQANGVLASGLCDDNPDVLNKVVQSKLVVKNYKLLHFGEQYNTMCMDHAAWRTSYMINNGLFA